jgi:hypothetical protein
MMTLFAASAGFIFPEILSGTTNVCFNFIIKYAGWLYL